MKVSPILTRRFWIDVAILLTSLPLAMTLRFGDLNWLERFDQIPVLLIAFAILITRALFPELNTTHLSWTKRQHLGLIAVIIVCAVSIVFASFLNLNFQIPRTVPFLYAILAFNLLVFSRFNWRASIKLGKTQNGAELIIMVGAYEKLMQMISSSRSSVLFVLDRDVKGLDRSISFQQAVDLIKKGSVRELVFDHGPSEFLEIRQRLELVAVHCRVPFHYTNTRGTVDSFASVIGRSSAFNRAGDQCTYNYGANVALVTGAAGSIGSSLCLMLAQAGVNKLIAVDQSEYGLFKLEQDLHETFPDTRVTVVIESILEHKRLFETLGGQEVDIVFNAAAYKHVTLAEANKFVSASTNILGALRMYELSIWMSAENFVQISTDKAVYPTTWMGKTKRVAEILLNEAPKMFRSKKLPTTSIVRFGNVYGSSGSVIENFQRCIESNKPLIITHPEVERYFMTVTEASSLVLEVPQLPDPEGIFILKMGEPVKILDVAKRLYDFYRIPEVDRNVQFSNLFPGEKISEELVFRPNQLTDELNALLSRANAEFKEMNRVAKDQLEIWWSQDFEHVDPVRSIELIIESDLTR